MTNATATRKRATPVHFSRPAAVDSTNVDIVGETQVVDLAQGAKIGIALPDVAGVLVDTDKVVSVSDEAFMNEPVTILMSDAPDDQAPQYVEVTVNGRYQCIPRGAQATIPRCHVAALANAKPMRTSQKKIVNPDGSMGYQESAVLSIAYPFSVIEDRNPRGGAWLRKLLQQPV